MNDRKNIILQRWGDTRPGLQSYIECAGRAYLTGLAAFSLSFAGCYSVQRLATRRLPYTANGQLLVSGVIAVVVAYKVTADRSRHCQLGWMATEDKHTYLNPLPERQGREDGNRETE